MNQKLISLFALIIFFINLLTIIVNASNDENLNQNNKLINNSNGYEESKALGRRRRPFGFFGHGLGYGFGVHALAILYWLKVKAVIITFIIGTAIVWGAKYFFAAKKCNHHDNIIEGPITFDHGPSWSGGHDHIPYSSSSLLSSDIPYSSYINSGPGGTDIPYSDHHDHHHDHIITNRHDKKWKRDIHKSSTQKENDDNMEEKIADIMFIFLGVDTNACRRRFVCEWEFHSRRHPITRMAFRIFGKGMFKKYTRDSNNANEAKSFKECAHVNYECSVIEENIDTIQKEPNNDIKRNINSRRKFKLTEPIAKTILSRKQ